MKYDIENINKRKKNTKIVKGILDVIIIILLYNIILVLISCVNKIDDVSIFGYKAYKITTDSMTPSINAGDVIIVKKKKVYTTKGDNNNLEDNETIEYANIEGKNVLTIPKLGYIINMLENQIVFLLIILILLILLFLKIKKDEKRENRREKKKIEQEKRNKD